MKKYKRIKLTPQLIDKLKPYYKTYKRLEELHWQAIQNLESKMSKEIGIEGLEFFFCDGYCAGIGNVDRTMKLIHAEEL